LILGKGILEDKDLFKSAVDSLLRDMKIGRSVMVLATKEKAGDLTQTENSQNPIVGLYVMKYFNNKERPVSYAKGQLLGNLIKEIQDTDVSTLPIIKSDEEGIMEISGAALIKDYEFVTWLDKDEVRGELFIEGNIRQVPIVVDYKGEYLTYFIKEQESKLKFKKDGGTWSCDIDVDVKGDITEYLSSEDKNIFNEESIKEITKLLEKEITRQMDVTLEKSKQLGIDFLGVGLEMYRKHPKEWKNYKETWHEGAYKALPIQLNTTVDIQNTGTLQ
jgi:Ger(x)C family germination protein